MLTTITPIAASLGLEPKTLILMGLLAGSFMVFLSLITMARDRRSARVGARMRSVGANAAAGASGGDAPVSLFMPSEAAPTGLAKAFLPTEQRERNKVRRDLVHAGFAGPNAVLWYYALRVGAGLLLPAAVVLVVLYRHALPLPVFLADRMAQMAGPGLLILFGVMILVGFYGPAFWISTQGKARRERIEREFPNALDLLQISIETGLGFDAALARVSAELQRTAPDVAQEFTVAQQEILAGRDREGAYSAMAERLAIDEAYAFVNVVLQSVRFGTSMSQALLVYSDDMRQRRELAAQEKANKLPVQMSAVMAILMMPTLLIVTIGPVVLRYVQTFPQQ